MSQYTYKRELNLVCAQRLPPGRCALESHPGTRNLAPERLAKKTNAPPACQIQNRARTQPCVRPTAPPWPLPSESHPGTNLAPECHHAKPNASPPPAKFKTARESNLVCAGPTAPPGRCPVKATPGPSNLAPEAHPGAREPHPGALPTLGRILTPRALPHAQVHRGRAKAPFPPQTRRRER